MKLAELSSAQRAIVTVLELMTEQEREQVFTFFCMGCLKSDAERGYPDGTDIPCQCEDDE